MKNRQFALLIFVFMQLCIYLNIISLNKYINPKIMCLSSIVICLIITIFMFCKTKDYFIMLSAIILSLISDIFLFVLPSIKVVGYIILNIIQICYFLRIFIDSQYKKSNILVRIITIPLLVFIGVIVLENKIDVNVILWIIFITNLFINILWTIKEIGINNLFPIGLLFMFMYGISIMVLNLENYVSYNVSILNFINNLSFDLRYAFYIPAQTFLAASVFTVNRKCFSKIKQDEE